jgi:hypothetical protein
MKHKALSLRVLGGLVLAALGACGGTVVLGGEPCPDSGLPEASPGSDAALDSPAALDAQDANDGADGEASPDAPDAGPCPLAVFDGGAMGTDAGDGGDACASADLQRDPHNCGACGHDCSGGFCDVGVCHVPEAIATGQAQPLTLVLAGTTLYWANSASGVAGAGSIASIAIGACTNDVRVAAPNLTAPYPMIQEGDSLYWAGDGTTAGNHTDGVIQRLVLSTGAVSSLTPATLSRPSGLAVAGGSLVWTQQGDPSQSYLVGSGVFRCPATGCTATPTTLASGSTGAVYRAFTAASDGVNAYWSVLGTLGSTYHDGAIYACPLTGCAGNPTLLTTDQPVSTGVLLDGSTLYWTTEGFPQSSGAGTVMRCTLPSCDATKVTLATNQLAPFRIAVDASYVYFTSSVGPNVLSRVPIGGGAVTHLFSSASGGAYGVALDGTYVYFTVFGTGAADGAVLRLRK